MLNLLFIYELFRIKNDYFYLNEILNLIVSLIKLILKRKIVKMKKQKQMLNIVYQCVK